MKTGEKARRGGQMLGTLVATIGSFSLGTVLAWPAPALPQLAKQHGISQGEAGLTVEEMSWVAALINVVGFAVGPLAGPLTSRYGIKVSRRHLVSIQCNRLLAGDHDAALLPRVPRMALDCPRTHSSLSLHWPDFDWILWRLLNASAYLRWGSCRG